MFLDAGDVILEPIRNGDEETLITQVLTNDQVMKLALDERAYTRSEAELFVSRHFYVQFPELGFGVVRTKSGGEVAGFAGYRPCEYLGCKDVEFGWVLALPHHGHGYAAALGEKLILHGLECLNLSRVLAACNPSNGASKHVLHHKLNMPFETEVEPKQGYRRVVFVALPGWRPPTRAPIRRK